MIHKLLMTLPAFLSTTLLACELDDIIEKSQRLKAQGRHFAAISWLEEQTQCDHPRIDLELGSLYLSVGQTDRAIAAWQHALKEHDLPENVVSNVKLRIIQTSLNPPESGSTRLQVGAEHAYQSLSGHSSALKLSVAGQWYFKPANALGYRMTPEAFAQLTTRQRLEWQPTQYRPLSVFSTGLRLKTKPLSLSVSSSLYALDNELVPVLRAELENTISWLTLDSRIEYRPDSERWQWHESVSVTGESLQVELGNTLETIDEQWHWESIEASIRLRNAMRPKLSVSWQPEQDQTEISSALRWPMNKQLWLAADAGIVLTDPSEISAKLSLNWQPF